MALTDREKERLKALIDARERLPPRYKAVTAGRTTLMAAVCGFVLAFPPQVREIYRAMAEATALGVSGSWVEPVASSVALVLLC